MSVFGSGYFGAGFFGAGELSMSFQPSLPNEVPFTDAELAFMDDSPGDLFPENQNSNFGYMIRKIFSDRLQEAINQLDTIYSERFVPTSVQYLDEWERMVGLPINTGQYTTAQRRNLILNRLRKGAFTRTMRQQIVESFIVTTFGDAPAFGSGGIAIDAAGIPLYSGVSSLAGAYRIVENIPAFSYDVRILNTIAPDIASLTRELTRVTPAGITFTITLTPTP